MGDVRPIAAYRRTQRSSLQLGLRVGGHLALTDIGQRNHSELSHMAGAVDDSTINIVVVIIIIIIKYLTLDIITNYAITSVGFAKV